jgi:hypothetical protein
MAENSGEFRRCATHRAALVMFLLLLAGCTEASSHATPIMTGTADFTAA